MGETPANVCTANVLNPTQSDETECLGQWKNRLHKQEYKNRMETMAVKDNGKNIAKN